MVCVLSPPDKQDTVFQTRMRGTDYIFGRWKNRAGGDDISRNEWKPLAGKGTFPAAIACILHGKDEPGISGPATKNQPYVTQDRPDFSQEEVRVWYENRENTPYPYIMEIKDRTVVGYKYFHYITAYNFGKSQTCRRRMV